MVDKKLYQIYTDNKLNYAVKLDNVGKYRSNAAISYRDYHTIVGSVKVDETTVEAELLDLIRPFALTCTTLPPP